MNRKEKIVLLNGILRGETPMSAVFNEWPEKTYYALPDDEDNYETEDGELVSLQEVDRQVMNYPKVRIISKEPNESEVKISYIHKYIDENGVEVEASGVRGQESEKDIDALSNPKIIPDFHSDTPSCHSDDRRNLIPQTPEPTPDPKPPPEPFLSRKDREVMAQGSLYCVR